jgi:hypothetical protein
LGKSAAPSRPTGGKGKQDAKQNPKR